MKFDPDKHHRRSIRLKEYDYSQPGAYFVTICTKNRYVFFEDSEIESFVMKTWLTLPDHFPNVALDEFVVMPNHIHGIIIIRKGEALTGEPTTKLSSSDVNASPLPNGTQPHSLGAIIQNFKSISSRKVHQINRHHCISLWQRNYYEHIIRNETDLNNIRQYTMDNPINWEDDENNPGLLQEAQRK